MPVFSGEDPEMFPQEGSEADDVEYGAAPDLFPFINIEKCSQSLTHGSLSPSALVWCSPVTDLGAETSFKRPLLSLPHG